MSISGDYVKNDTCKHRSLLWPICMVNRSLYSEFVARGLPNKNKIRKIIKS